LFALFGFSGELKLTCGWKLVEICRSWTQAAVNTMRERNIKATSTTTTECKKEIEGKARIVCFCFPLKINFLLNDVNNYSDSGD